MIEIGRHKNVSKDTRFCPFCPNVIENEIHFLFHCPVYSNIRDMFLKMATENKPEFYTYSDNERLEYIMNNIDGNVARYINESFELRTFLQTHPKRNI